MILQSALISPLAQQPTTSSSQWWWLLIIGLILLIAFFYWWRQVSEEDLDTIVAFEQKHPQALAMPAGFAPPVIEETPDHSAHDAHSAHDEHAHEEETAEETAVTPDDLKRIEGIGPKIAELLNGAGIVTFTQLAAADPADLEKILAEGGARFQLADPASWSRQAKLAAAADWTALEALQDTLKAGRHVEDAE